MHRQTFMAESYQISVHQFCLSSGKLRPRNWFPIRATTYSCTFVHIYWKYLEKKKMFVRAFTSHIIAERFIKNKYPFVIAKDTTWKYPRTQDSGRNFKRQALTQVLWVTGNISVKRKDVKNIHFIYNNFYVAFGRWNVLITAPFVKK